MSEEDLQAQIDELKAQVAEFARRGSGISQVFGRNPLMEKYASLGWQALQTIKAGATFNDTLGKFFPIVIEKQGGVTVNGSANFPNFLRFHNTKDASDPNVVLYHPSLGFIIRQAADVAGATFFEIDFLNTRGNGWKMIITGTNGVELWSNTAAKGDDVAIRSTSTENIHYGRFAGVAGTTTSAPLNLPHGVAPTSPINGDIWTTTAGLFVRVNGVTVGPLS